MTFRDLEILFGKHTEAGLTLAFAGGKSDGKLWLAAGMPLFDRGSRYLLELTNRPSYRFTPTADWDRAVYRLGDSGLTTYGGAPVVAFDAANLEFVTGPVASMGLLPEVDPVYGSYGPYRGEAGRPPKGGSQVRGDARASARGLTELEATNQIRARLSGWDLSSAPDSRTVPPGTRFTLRRLRASPPPLAAAALPGPPGEVLVANREPSAIADERQRAGDWSGSGFFATDCAGELLRWNANAATLKRLPISFPTGGVFTQVVLTAEEQWSAVPGSSFRYSDRIDNDATVDLDGDGNEIAFVDPSDTDGAAGLAFVAVDDCRAGRAGANMSILEANVVFPTSLPRNGSWSLALVNTRSLFDALGRHYFAPVVTQRAGARPGSLHRGRTPRGHGCRDHEQQVSVRGMVRG